MVAISVNIDIPLLSTTILLINGTPNVITRGLGVRPENIPHHRNENGRDVEIKIHTH